MPQTKIYQCASCDYETDDSPLFDGLSSRDSRAESDDLMGAGECPECGAMVFDTTGHNYQVIHNHDKILNALRAIFEYASDWETGCDDPRDIRDAEDEHASAMETARDAIVAASR